MDKAKIKVDKGKNRENPRDPADEPAAKPVSLAPLKFEDAVAALAAVRPEGPNQPKSK